jgi:hypothetical protein
VKKVRQALQHEVNVARQAAATAKASGEVRSFTTQDKTRQDRTGETKTRHVKTR